jgi:hypothetical protein
VTRGANFRGSDSARYRREVREPMTRLRAWLPGPCVWTSSRVRAVLAAIMDQYPTVGDIPFKPAPPTRTGLTPCYLRITQKQRGMIDLMARIHGTPGEPLPVSETLRGILAAWMEATE